MTTYTATAAPDGAVTIDAERACAGLHACLRILFLVSAHNSLSQRVWTELTDLGHEVAVAVVATAEEMEAAVAAHPPELIVCPMLKTMIPERVWAAYRCLIVHPGPRGDRGPSSLDWAIELGARDWGVTVLEANAEADAARRGRAGAVYTRSRQEQLVPPRGPPRRHRGGVRGGQPDRHRSEVGPQVAAELTGAPFTPLSAAQAARIGLIESAFGLTADSFRARLMEHAQRLAADPDLGPRLERKRTRRAADERTAAGGLPQARARTLPRVLLRPRSQLPRRPPQVRAQARRALRDRRQPATAHGRQELRAPRPRVVCARQTR